jgi:hypothetical protein
MSNNLRGYAENKEFKDFQALLNSRIFEGLNFCSQIQGLSNFVRTLLQGTGISSELRGCMVNPLSGSTLRLTSKIVWR